VPSDNSPDHAYRNKSEADARSLPGAVPEETKERIHEKDKPRKGSEQNQPQKVVGISIFDCDSINQWRDDQNAANETTSDRIFSGYHAHKNSQLLEMRGLTSGRSAAGPLAGWIGAPEFNSKLYHGSIGLRCGRSAAVSC
jgi:hypothetical protein